jgi:hypothetical protein
MDMEFQDSDEYFNIMQEFDNCFKDSNMADFIKVLQKYTSDDAKLKQVAVLGLVMANNIDIQYDIEYDEDKTYTHNMVDIVYNILPINVKKFAWKNAIGSERKPIDVSYESSENFGVACHNTFGKVVKAHGGKK